MLFNQIFSTVTVISSVLIRVVVCLPANVDSLLDHYDNVEFLDKRAALPTATVESGPLFGTTTSLPSASATVNKFLGVPYASLTQRFAPAQTPAQFSGQYDATKKPPACLQVSSSNAAGGLQAYPLPSQAEDCLFLNIFAPSTTPPTGGWAVMFWIHGGGLRNGYSADPTYDGSAFAAFQNVIVVTTNYRLNAFGFPNVPNPVSGIGNLGLDDQRMAMQWVQRNIKAFSGNPNKVTIFGESAGSWSVDIHYTAYTTDAPFRAAILESSQVTYGPQNSQTPGSWTALVQQVNCTGSTTAKQLACVRALPATTVQDAVTTLSASGVPFSSYPDGVTQFSDPITRLQNGDFSKVPILLGTNADEYRALTAYPPSITFPNYVDLLVSRLTNPPSGLAQSIKDAFPVGNAAGVNQTFDRIAELNTLAILQCPMGALGNETASLNVPTWRYLYNASFPNWEPTTNIPGGLEVFHSSEITEVFQTYPGGPINPVTSKPSGLYPTNIAPTSGQMALASLMNANWATFAKSPTSGPGWLKLGTANTQDIRVLGRDNGTGPFLSQIADIDAQCALLQPLLQICGAESGCTGGSGD